MISSLSIAVNELPKNYHFKNWNRGLVKTAIPAPKHGHYLAGKDGLWFSHETGVTKITNPLADNVYQNYIYSLSLDKLNNELYLGSRDGLFRYSIVDDTWFYYQQSRKKRIVSLIAHHNKLFAITNYEVFSVNKNLLSPIPIQLAPSDQKTPLFRFVFALHSGEILGITGVLLMDILAIALIFFCLSGLYQWLFPRVLKKFPLTRTSKIKGGRIFRFLYNNHNVIGLVLAPLLIISSITAMVMRPPGLLLISAAQSPISVLAKQANSAVPYKITKAVWHNASQELLLLTDDGVYKGSIDHCSSQKVCNYHQIPMSAPVHGMGATIFQPYQNGRLLIGSFSGLYSWQPENNVSNKITLSKQLDALLPMAAHSINNELIVYDYFRGKLLDSDKLIATMPTQVNNTARMGLWNFFFELHNARIFQAYIGPFYLLLLLVIALALLILTITGLINYLKKKRFLSRA